MVIVQHYILFLVTLVRNDIEYGFGSEELFYITFFILIMQITVADKVTNQKYFSVVFLLITEKSYWTQAYHKLTTKLVFQ